MSPTLSSFAKLATNLQNEFAISTFDSPLAIWRVVTVNAELIGGYIGFHREFSLAPSDCISSEVCGWNALKLGGHIESALMLRILRLDLQNIARLLRNSSLFGSMRGPRKGEKFIRTSLLEYTTSFSLSNACTLT